MSDYAAPLALIGVLLVAVGVTVGGWLASEQYPTKYANGFCAALNGERLNDESCNVDGKVVTVQ